MYWKTRTWPRCAACFEAPIAITEPSPERVTEMPLKSPASTPSISSPIWDQSPSTDEYSNTRTCPALGLLPSAPSFRWAPIATRVPSPDKETDLPLRSRPRSPSISEPTWLQSPSDDENSKMRTWPAKVSVPLLRSAAIAKRKPSAERDTAPPAWSPAVSPKISAPILLQELVPSSNSNTRTSPALAPAISLNLDPTATRPQSSDIDTLLPKLSPAKSPVISDPT